MNTYKIEEITALYGGAPFEGVFKGTLGGAQRYAERKQRYLGTWLSVTDEKTGAIHVKKKDKWEAYA